MRRLHRFTKVFHRNAMVAPNGWPSYLTEELVRQGHEVTLFASGDSVTKARLIAPCPRSLRLDNHCVDQLAHHIVELELVQKESPRFDIMHFHLDYLHFPLSRRQSRPHLTTLHGHLDIPDLVPLYQEFAEVPVISISNAQRQPLPWLNWQGTVYHGLPEDLYRYHDTPQPYLAFLGRISPEKRVDRAYFESIVAPLLEGPLVEYVGEISDREKDEFLGNAYALLFPIDWPEPFGLVMIEALASGTPVIAYRQGSVPEVIDDGVTGFIVDELEEAVTAVGRLCTLSRSHCRRAFEQRFSVSRMTEDYLALYQKLIGSKPTPLYAA